MPVIKPRRRRVWENPPESRKAWKKNKKADLRKAGLETRHAVKKAAVKAEKRAAKKEARESANENA